ncbi:hypothetical protein TIFTF001_021923 [Ficus carica]|uniref:Amino acid transporter transmembrane domain-containing protein n=1 Tax=Ficus carica TaxID=3494 RepID=A0AA88DCB9_FICCA|nr:hypothetical protein TIFTF001_021923 [Ficus carica]
MQNGVLKGGPPPPTEVDTRALCSLESPQGSWLHCSYHLTTSMVSPALLCLPSALAMHHAQLGRPQFQYRDMATDILGNQNQNALITKNDPATIAPPVKEKMLKGLRAAYSVMILTNCSVAVSGHWAFGNQAKGTVLSNFVAGDRPLLPTWFLVITNIFILLQFSAVTSRLIFRSTSVIIATTLDAMLPFIEGLVALFGAFGCIPLDTILPMVFYNNTFKPSKYSVIFLVNTTIIVVSSLLAGIGTIASVYKIVSDAKMVHLFPNL